MSFSEMFGTSNRLILKRKGAKHMRKARGERTLLEMQQELKNRGAIENIDISKQSRWENSKQIPNILVQKCYHAMHNEKTFNVVTGGSYGFDMPISLLAVRRIVFNEQYDDALSILSDLDFDDPNVRAYTVLVKASIYYLKGDISTARITIDSLVGITDQLLAIAVDNFNIGLKFEAIKNTEDPKEQLESIASDLRLNIQRYPKQKKFQRNIMRVYSALKDAEGFLEQFERLHDIADCAEREELIDLILEDDNYTNARSFKSMKKYLNPRIGAKVKSRLQAGFASTTSLTSIALLAIVLLTLFQPAQAAELKTVSLFSTKAGATLQAEFSAVKPRVAVLEAKGWEWDMKELTDNSNLFTAVKFQKGWEWDMKEAFSPLDKI